MAASVGLLDLPVEVLQHILTIVTTPSYLQTALTCKKFYELAASSRSVVLHHLQTVPGIKIGLDDPTVTATDLFLLFRQRASKHLVGANFIADCRILRSRNAQIDVDASFLSNVHDDYVTTALMLKDTQSIRLYTAQCALKERITSPYCGGKVKILQVINLQVINERPTIAVLHEWQPEDKQKTPPLLEKPLVLDHPYKKPNDLSATAPLDLDGEDSSSETEDEPPQKEVTRNYHVQFYDWTSCDTPVTYTIDRHKTLVPRHFAVSSRLLWAILWDVEGSSMPTAQCEIVQYTSPKHPAPLEDTSHDSRVVWPTEFDPAPLFTESDVIKGLAPKLPKQIAFFKEGRRLSLYASGEIVPFKILGVGSLRESRSPINAIYFENRTVFSIDTSFYGKHETYFDPLELRQFCNLTHLCLGVGEIRGPHRKCKILCILRSRTKTDHDDCRHLDLENRMYHVSAENCKAVARLWGWSDTASTLTGLDMVAVSKRGTRIAIAQWDRVLIWSLDPQMLCEAVAEIDSDDDGGKKSRRKKKVKSKSVADSFYEWTRDSHMGWKIADLKPIVLDLDGAVARKMTWSISDETDDDDDDDDNSNDDQSSTVEEFRAEDVDPDGDVKSQMSQTVTESTEVGPAMTSPDPHVPLSPSAFVSGQDPIQLHAQSVPDDGSQNSSEDGPKSARLEVKEPVSQVGPKAEPVEPVPGKNPVDRSLPTSHPQRARHVIVGEKPVVESVELRNGSTPETVTIPDGTGLAKLAPVAPVIESDPNVVEPLPSPYDKPSTEPKGKGKETDAAVSDPPNQPAATVSDKVPAMKTAPIIRKKRFSEDELVILTDRGFQIWDFGIWGKRLRARRWLEEE